MLGSEPPVGGSPPVARELLVLDPRARSDRHDAERCASCDRLVRWVRNAGSARENAHIQVVARPVARGRWFDLDMHRGLIAVDAFGAGRTVGRGESLDRVRDAWLYRCHWDVCSQARAVRDRRSAQLRDLRAREVGPEARSAAELAAERFAAWRGASGSEGDDLG